MAIERGKTSALTTYSKIHSHRAKTASRAKFRLFDKGIKIATSCCLVAHTQPRPCTYNFPVNLAQLGSLPHELHLPISALKSK